MDSEDGKYLWYNTFSLTNQAGYTPLILYVLHKSPFIYLFIVSTTYFAVFYKVSVSIPNGLLLDPAKTYFLVFYAVKLDDSCRVLYERDISAYSGFFAYTLPPPAPLPSADFNFPPAIMEVLGCPNGLIGDGITCTGINFRYCLAFINEYSRFNISNIYCNNIYYLLFELNFCSVVN